LNILTTFELQNRKCYMTREKLVRWDKKLSFIYGMIKPIFSVGLDTH